MERGGRLVALLPLPSLLLLLLLLPSSSLRLPEIKPLVYEEQLLWVGGVQGQVNTYRVPLLTFTSKGTLLAFAEGRKMSAFDGGAKFIAMRRSIDKGSTWSPTTFITDDGPLLDGVNLGSVVVDKEKDLVILIYTVCFHLCHPSKTMIVESTDDGLSWSAPRNLSNELGIKNFAPGPGSGLQKRHNPAKGRLVVCGHGTIEGDGVFCILSDDHGTTWKTGGMIKSIPFNQKKKEQDFNPDEPQPVELEDGTIVINVRNQFHYHCRCRVVVRSYDGGSTLDMDDMYFDEELVDPAVAAGLLQKNGVMYFTNPSNEQSRINMTLRWSLTNGKTWEKNAVQIWPGPSGYSCITSLDTGTQQDNKYIFVIYEKGHHDSCEFISFAKIHLYDGR